MTKYIPLEELEKIWRLNHTPELMVVHPEGQYISLNNIYYLPTIDPIAIIDKMQEEYKKDPTVGDGSFDYDVEVLLQDARYSVLGELKSRLSTNL